MPAAPAPVPAPPQPQVAPPRVITHVVAAGETVTAIAARYGVSTTTVVSSAGLRNPNRIYPGQTLTFPSVDGTLHRVRTGENLGDIAKLYQVDPGAITRANEIADPNRLAAGQVLIVPGARPRRPAAIPSSSGGGAQVASSGSGSANSASTASALAWPLRGSISSYYGPRWGRTHTGIDISASYGAAIRAAGSGKVAYAGWYGLYGRCVIIDHGGGLKTLYAHASKIAVTVGQHVERGEIIAYVGSSGNSTGPHLHFEVRVSGRTRNPLSYLGQ